ncbi:MAG TPA: exodeoxyribonuclease III [Kofleriaceae bacterium]|nr:exodeoxyribonuclease III [Kofleriaceae bacterium]
MKLATWNINSIRARNERLLAWLDKERPDVLCLQETKVEDAAFPGATLAARGYETVTFGQKSYNGVAILSTQPLTDVTRAFGDGEDDDDARVIAATTHGIRVICAYVVNGQELTSDRYPYKLAWLRRMRAMLDRTAKPDEPVVLCGDMNVAPDDRDVWSPEKWKEQIHCSSAEREALAHVLAFGLHDLFRKHHGDDKVYSWWDYRGVSFFKDQGLRIDHVFGTKAIYDRCTSCTIDRTARKGQDASDHAPVIAVIE